MTKAPDHAYRAAKIEALRAIGRIESDAAAPDEVRFRNEAHGFVVRLYRGDFRIETVFSWEMLFETVAPNSVVIGEEIAESINRLALAEKAVE